MDDVDLPKNEYLHGAVSLADNEYNKIKTLNEQDETKIRYKLTDEDNVLEDDPEPMIDSLKLDADTYLHHL